MKTTIALVLLASTAHADPFAGPRIGVADLVWPLTAACDKGDDTQQRQCRQLRDRKAQTVASGSLVVEGKPSAFELGAWDAAKKSVSMKLVACIDCDGSELDGKRWHVVGTGARADGGKLRGAILYDTAKVFPDEAAATTWSKPLGKVRVEYVVKLPAKPRAAIGGKDAIQVEVTGWRVIEACSGAIVASKPESSAVAPDKSACRQAVPKP